MQFHVLSFEGPDGYAKAGGLASRVGGLTSSLAEEGFETHLWFIGDPDRPGEEASGNVRLHRWCQWLSQYHRGGVYDGEEQKHADYAASLPPYLVREALLPHVGEGRHAVILAEEWQTVHAVLHLDWILRELGMRNRVSIFWNANNTFGFDRIDWGRLREAATITTVSRYMRHRMWAWGVDPVVIPNGLGPDAFARPDSAAVARLRLELRERTIITKMARWDPDKRWLESVGVVAALKQQGWRPLLIARGGNEAHGADVMAAAQRAGLSVVERQADSEDVGDFLQAVGVATGVDVVSLRTPVGPDSRRVLFRAADVVLANSSHEPFGLVGLETMAVGGIACTGCSGEDYTIPGQNALVLQTGDPREFVGLYRQLRDDPAHVASMRRAGHWTARRYAWPQVLRRNLLPRLELLRSNEGPPPGLHGSYVPAA
jgi:glycosyltransferase involved in cell wall biosynthesis